MNRRVALLVILLGLPACTRTTPGPVVTEPEPRTPQDSPTEELEARMPAGFHLVVEGSWWVVGDEPAERVRGRAVATVAWADRMLRKELFDTGPAEPLEVWLFKDKTSYEAHCLSLFGEEPHTPFGYYSPDHNALIMNIATGGGTLVHEMVHPFVRADFPSCPAWFNEGLGSLYEQCNEVEGRIRGLTNWRLAGLQEALEDGTAPSLESLVALSDVAFYGPGTGVHYAVARYLCYWLQEQELLPRYYQEFRDHPDRDPTGWQALLTVLGDRDPDLFQRDWESFVQALTFR